MSREQGGATILALAWLAILTLVGVGVASIGILLTAREVAVTAAEAAALAAAVSTYPGVGLEAPTERAAEYAGRNGATLVECRCPVDPSLEPRVVTVVTERAVRVPLFGTVSVKGAARSEFDPGLWLGAG